MMNLARAIFDSPGGLRSPEAGNENSVNPFGTRSDFHTLNSMYF